MGERVERGGADDLPAGPCLSVSCRVGRQLIDRLLGQRRHRAVPSRTTSTTSSAATAKPLRSSSPTHVMASNGPDIEESKTDSNLTYTTDNNNSSNRCVTAQALHHLPPTTYVDME